MQTYLDKIPCFAETVFFAKDEIYFVSETISCLLMLIKLCQLSLCVKDLMLFHSKSYIRKTEGKFIHPLYKNNFFFFFFKKKKKKKKKKN